MKIEIKIEVDTIFCDKLCSHLFRPEYNCNLFGKALCLKQALPTPNPRAIRCQECLRMTYKSGEVIEI